MNKQTNEVTQVVELDAAQVAAAKARAEALKAEEAKEGSDQPTSN